MYQIIIFNFSPAIYTKNNKSNVVNHGTKGTWRNHRNDWKQLETNNLLLTAQRESRVVSREGFMRKARERRGQYTKEVVRHKSDVEGQRTWKDIVRLFYRTTVWEGKS